MKNFSWFFKIFLDLPQIFLIRENVFSTNEKVFSIIKNISGPLKIHLKRQNYFSADKIILDYFCPVWLSIQTPLESCDVEKDLGVWVSSNLTSDKQVSEQCGKANKLLGFVRQVSRSSKAPKRVVHCTFLLSDAISAMQPEYGCHSPLP